LLAGIGYLIPTGVGGRVRGLFCATGEAGARDLGRM